MEIKVTNVNQCLSECLHWLLTAGVEENSRNGPVLVSPEPVLVTYTRPTERVLFSPLRDANPFFHLVGEAIWMLAGRNDLDFPLYFNKNFANYSDDGETVHGAYGNRWRRTMGFDQLKAIAEELKRNPESRRCVLQMWDSTDHSVEIDGYNPRLVGMNDFGVAIAGGKDVPCNTQAYFDLRGGALNMTVTNRSNDLIWGLAGANAVHFSVLLEYMAAWVGAPVGEYRQFTNNLHLYTAVVGDREKIRALATDASAHDYYAQGKVTPLPLVNTDIATWDRDLAKFFLNPLRNPLDYEDVFFSDTVRPMYRAWYDRRELGLNGLAWAERIAAPDWRAACTEWIGRRAARRQAAQSA